MKKNKFLKIILSFILALNITNITPTYAMDPSQDNSSHREITLTLFLTKYSLVKDVQIDVNSPISDLNPILNQIGYPVDIIYNGSIVDINKKVSEVFINNAFVFLTPKGNNNNQNFLRLSERTLLIDAEIKKLCIMSASDNQAKQAICFRKDCDLFRLETNPKRYRKFIKNWNNKKSPTLNSHKIPTGRNSQEKPSEPSTEPLPKIW